MQSALVEWARGRVESFSAKPVDELDAVEWNRLRTLAVALYGLGKIQLHSLGQPSCIEAFAESFELGERLGDKAGAANCGIDMANAYIEVSAVRDLDKAESCLKHSQELFREIGDGYGQGKCLSQLGALALEHAESAEAAGDSEDMGRWLSAALQYYRQALELVPKDAVNSLNVIHNQLAIIYGRAGHIDLAVHHFQESISYEEIQGNIFGAAQSRCNIAVFLAEAGRFNDALDYAHAGLRNFETYGDHAKNEIRIVRGLIEGIEQLMRTGGGT